MQQTTNVVESANFAVGDIVTWLTHSGKLRKVQGRVYAINPENEDPIEVEFFSESKWLFGADWVWERNADNSFTIDFSQEDLRKEKDWDFENILKRNGADKCLEVLTPKQALVKGSSICMNESCSELAYEYSFVNIHGVMYVFHTCTLHHKEINGRWADFLPAGFSA